MIQFGFKTYKEYEEHIKNQLAKIKPVHAKDAKESVLYFCTYCGCPMFRRRSPNNIYHYKCQNGKYHDKPFCKTLYKNKKSVITALTEEFSIEKLWEYLLLQ